MESNYPAGVTSAHPYFNQPDAPEYDYDTAVEWIERYDLGVALQEFLLEKKPDVIKAFRDSLHPKHHEGVEDGDLLAENEKLFDEFFWTVLDQAMREDAVEAFAEADWNSYEEYATIENEPDDEDRDR